MKIYKNNISILIDTMFSLTSSKVLPTINVDNQYLFESSREGIRNKRKSNYCTSRRAARATERGVNVFEKRSMDRRVTDYEKTEGKKTRKKHNKAKVINIITQQNIKEKRRVTNIDEWEYMANEYWC